MSRRLDQRGVSLIEVLVAVIVFALVLLSLAATGGVAARQVYKSRSDMHVWVSLQEQVEILANTGYDALASDSAVTQGYPTHWTVSGTNPKKVVFVLERTNLSGHAVEDTVILYFADPTP